MKFSIIIPIFNVEKYLEKCLDSVFSQTFHDYEAICVNDGSTDGSLEILTKIANIHKQITIINQTNAGTSAARNAGLKAASGDYIWFVDSDDWIEPYALQSLANKLAGEDMLCFSGKRFFKSTSSFEAPDTLLPEKNITGWEYYNNHALEPRAFSFVCVVLRIYKRSFLLKNNLFFDTHITHEDNLWIPQTCFFAHSVSIVSDALYIYRIREKSKMGEVSSQRKKDIILVANQLAEFFINQNSIDKGTIYKAITHHYQVAFLNASPEEDQVLLPNVRWDYYKAVSRTKFRHRLQYLLIKITPSLFRLFLRSL